MIKVIITGASKSIGLYMLQQFKERGFCVYGSYNTTQPPCDLFSYFKQVDVSRTEQVKLWIDGIVEPSDKIILINCAAINYNVLGRKADVERWEHVIDVNLLGTFRSINAVLPHMYESKYGRIINFSSIVAQKPVHGTSAYAASKAALWGMTKCLAAENAAYGITINTINLGYMNTGMTLDSVPEQMRKQIYEQIPMRRFGEIGEVLNTVNYLIDTEYITGTSIDLNGGLY